MADTEGLVEARNVKISGAGGAADFHIRGSSHLDWGMKNRLSRIIKADTGRTVMLAVDHGIFRARLPPGNNGRNPRASTASR